MSLKILTSENLQLGKSTQPIVDSYISETHITTAYIEKTYNPLIYGTTTMDGPYIKYDSTSQRWKLSNDGTTIDDVRGFQVNDKIGFVNLPDDNVSKNALLSIDENSGNLILSWRSKINIDHLPSENKVENKVLTIVKNDQDELEIAWKDSIKSTDKIGFDNLPDNPAIGKFLSCKDDGTGNLVLAWVELKYYE